MRPFLNVQKFSWILIIVQNRSHDMSSLPRPATPISAPAPSITSKSVNTDPGAKSTTRKRDGIFESLTNYAGSQFSWTFMWATSIGKGIWLTHLNESTGLNADTSADTVEIHGFNMGNPANSHVRSEPRIP